MYSKRFLFLSRIGVYIAMVMLVGVTLFGSIAPASPMLEQTKRDLDDKIPAFIYWSWHSEARDETHETKQDPFEENSHLPDVIHRESEEVGKEQ